MEGFFLSIPVKGLHSPVSVLTESQSEQQEQGRRGVHLLLGCLSLGVVQHSGADLCHLAWEAVPLSGEDVMSPGPSWVRR